MRSGYQTLSSGCMQCQGRRAGRQSSESESDVSEREVFEELHNEQELMIEWKEMPFFGVVIGRKLGSESVE